VTTNYLFRGCMHLDGDRGECKVEIEKQLKALKERIERLEEQVESIQYEPPKSRPAWLDFLISFLVIFVIIMLTVGVVSFLSN
jgi:hypothetical protein